MPADAGLAEEDRRTVPQPDDERGQRISGLRTTNATDAPTNVDNPLDGALEIPLAVVNHGLDEEAVELLADGAGEDALVRIAGDTDGLALIGGDRDDRLEIVRLTVAEAHRRPRR